MPQFDVFLSHYSGDADLADGLRRALVSAGVSVWYDGTEIALGDSVLGKMQEGLQKSSYGLILFTPGFLSSTTGFRWSEVEAYLASQLTAGRTQLLPVVAGVRHEDFERALPLLRARRYERLELAKSGRPTRYELKRVAGVVAETTTSRVSVQLAGRGDINTIIGSMDDRLAATRQELMVSGNDCKALVESKSGFVADALDRGVAVKVLCVDPDSPIAVETLVRIDPRFEDCADFVASMQSVERTLARFRRHHPDRFEFRYLPIAPAVGLYISDPGLPTALLKVEMYTPKPWAPMVTRPHLAIKQHSPWWDYFLSTWHNYWTMSRVPA